MGVTALSAPKAYGLCASLAAKLLRRLIEGEIHSKFRLNIPLQKKFSAKLKETVNKYNNGSIEAWQVIDELLN